MKCIIGTKKGMTQIFKEDGTVVPVTRVQAGPCTVTQVKSKAKDGVNSIQVGFGEQKVFRINKSIQGHLNGLANVRYMHEFRTNDAHEGLERGDMFTVKTFENGEKVHVTGTSKGKGFQGVVKRYNFKGQAASHGNKDQLRMPGSIGSTGPARVFKGTRMGGHMGAEQVTVQNLEIAGIDEETNELLIKGAVPGAKGSLLYIYTREGTITKQEAAEEVVAVTEETTPEVEAPTTEAAPVETAKEEAPAEEAKEEVAPEASADKEASADANETKEEAETAPSVDNETEA